MTPASSNTKQANGGFSFVEVLVAMVFMAIVIPVAVEGFLIANGAGAVAERKRVAAQLAHAKLTELAATGTWATSETSGDYEDDWPGYTWEIIEESWNENNMILLTAVVRYEAQGKPYEVRLSTLVYEEEDEDDTLF